MITLKGFSQEVDLSDMKKVQYFLVFDNHGKTLRLPVQKETTEALAVELYGEQEQETLPPPAREAPNDMDDELEGATQFGGVVEEDFNDPPDIYEGPDSEDEVPSV